MPKLKGYVTKAKFIRGQSAGELEARLGFRKGRLNGGWRLYFLDEMPRPDDFEYRGYSQMSGGVERGHNPARSDGRTAEDRLRGSGADLMRLKERTVREVFAISGSERLAKVVPNDPATGENDYPPGTGIPQWQLTRELVFHLAAKLGLNEVYQGDYG